jgi:hypothetical protein
MEIPIWILVLLCQQFQDDVGNLDPHENIYQESYWLSLYAPLEIYATPYWLSAEFW